MKPILSICFLLVILVTLAACRPTPEATALFTPTSEITATSTPTATTAVLTPTPATLPPLPPVTGKVNLEILGTIGGNVKGIVLWDDFAVLSIGLRLEVLSLAEPGTPRSVSRSDLLPGVPAALTDVDSYIYVAIPGSGLLVFDLSDPTRPEKRTGLELPIAPRSLHRQDGLLVIAGDSCQENGCTAGLAFIDIAKPERPQLLGTLELPVEIVEMQLVGGKAYLYDQSCQSDSCTYSLRIVDINTRLMSGGPVGLKVPGPLVKLALDRKHLLLAHYNGLIIFDLSQPDNPQQISQLKIDNLNSFSLHGQVAIAVSFGPKIQVVDLSNPAHPRLGSPMPQGNVFIANPGSAVIYDRIFYLVDTFGEFGHCWSSLHVLDISDPAVPTQVNTEQDTLMFTCASQPYIAGKWMVVPDWRAVHFVDLSDSIRPRLHGSYPLAVMYGNLFVQDGFLYATNGLASDSLLVVELNTTSEPLLHGPFGFGWTWGIVSDGKYLYIPSWSNGLVVADIRSPTRPKQAGVLESASLEDPDPKRLMGYAYRVAQDGSRLVVGVGDAGIQLVDVSNPLKPAPLGIIDLRVGDNYIGADWLAAHQGFFYVVDFLPRGVEGAPAMLVVVDARDPLHLTQVNQLDLPLGSSPVALHYSNGYLLLATNRCLEGRPGCFGRFSIYDLSDPNVPQEISTLEFPFELTAMSEAGKLAFLSAVPDRLLVVDLSNPSSFSLAALFQVPGCAGNSTAEEHRVYISACDAGVLFLGIEQ